MEVSRVPLSGWEIAHRAVGESPSPTTQWEIPHLDPAEVVDDGSMHDPRTSTALRRLAELTADPPASLWSWAAAKPDTKGRLGLPRDALDALGPGPVTLRWNRLAVVLEPAPGTITIDGRARVLLPAHLRHLADTYFVGSDRERGLVVVAPACVFDAFAEVLAGTTL